MNLYGDGRGRPAGVMKGMLSGVTILELGQVIAGTYGGMILADLGAEVIKIEPHWGDAARNPKITPVEGESAVHLQLNRGKKSVVIDLKSETGREILYAPGGPVGRGHRQLPARCDGSPEDRPRKPGPAQPAHHHRFGNRIRRQRTGPPPARLRSGGAGL